MHSLTFLGAESLIPTNITASAAVATELQQREPPLPEFSARKPTLHPIQPCPPCSKSDSEICTITKSSTACSEFVRSGYRLAPVILPTESSLAAPKSHYTEPAAADTSASPSCRSALTERNSPSRLTTSSGVPATSVKTLSEYALADLGTPSEERLERVCVQAPKFEDTADCGMDATGPTKDPPRERKMSCTGEGDSVLLAYMINAEPTESRSQQDVFLSQVRNDPIKRLEDDEETMNSVSELDETMLDQIKAEKAAEQEAERERAANAPREERRGSTDQKTQTTGDSPSGGSMSNSDSGRRSSSGSGYGGAGDGGDDDDEDRKNVYKRQLPVDAMDVDKKEEERRRDSDDRRPSIQNITTNYSIERSPKNTAAMPVYSPIDRERNGSLSAPFNGLPALAQSALEASGESAKSVTTEHGLPTSYPEEQGQTKLPSIRSLSFDTGVPPPHRPMNNLQQFADVATASTGWDRHGAPPNLSQPPAHGASPQNYTRQPSHPPNHKTQYLPPLQAPPSYYHPQQPYPSFPLGSDTANSSSPYSPPPLSQPLSSTRDLPQMASPTAPYYSHQSPSSLRRTSSSSFYNEQPPSGPSTGETFGSSSDDTLAGTPLPQYNNSRSSVSSFTEQTQPPQNGGFKCKHEGCTAPPFATQYLLK